MSAGRGSELARPTLSGLPHQRTSLRQADRRRGSMSAALMSMVGNVPEYANGRQLAAKFGLVPGQYSSSGKTRLGCITTAGDPYARTLLVLDARAVLNIATNKTDSLSRGTVRLRECRSYWKVVH